MSSKIEMSRELLEDFLNHRDNGDWYEGIWITHLDKLRALLAAPVVERQPVAYLDIGAGGYMDLGSDLTDEQLQALPNGRHMLGIVGTHGIDGYTAPPELAELQATIARLTAENEAVTFNLDKTDKRYLAAVAEIERLKGGQGEAVALTVWEGAMPESNGRSNFTVILHTGDLTEGICVYRSEHPDRARYEADCFRRLIGDPAFPEKPFICDYDADKHSGYVKPDTSQLAPVSVVPEGWKLVPIEPTDDMIVAFSEGWYSKRQAVDDPDMLDAYRDMLTAAPDYLEKGKP